MVVLGFRGVLGVEVVFGIRQHLSQQYIKESNISAEVIYSLITGDGLFSMVQLVHNNDS